MPHADPDEEFDDDYDKKEYPNEHEVNWNLNPADDICPYCKGEITEDTIRCPHCGNYISQEETRSRRKPLWIIIGLILIALALIGLVLFK